MRTNFNIAADVRQFAQIYADAKGLTLGAAITELIRKAQRSESVETKTLEFERSPAGFPVSLKWVARSRPRWSGSPRKTTLADVSYLPDVNVLLALSDTEHAGHKLASRWFKGIGNSRFILCPITEAGFIQNSAHGDLLNARRFLIRCDRY